MGGLGNCKSGKAVVNKKPRGLLARTTNTNESFLFLKCIHLWVHKSAVQRIISWTPAKATQALCDCTAAEKENGQAESPCCALPLVRLSLRHVLVHGNGPWTVVTRLIGQPCMDKADWADLGSSCCARNTETSVWLQRPQTCNQSAKGRDELKLLEMSEASGLYTVLCRDQDPISAKCFDECKSSLFLRPGSSEAQVEVYLSSKPSANDFPSEDEVTFYFAKEGLTAGTLQPTRDEKPLHQKSLGDQQTRLVAIKEIESLKRHVCRKQALQVFFIRQRNSYSSLKITLSLFETLLSLKHVSPKFKDHITYMGERKREVEIAPPKLRWRRSLACCSSSISDTIECMYNLRYVELNGRGELDRPTSRWSLRQSAVHYSQPRLGSPGSWIFITLSHIAESRLSDCLPRYRTESVCGAFGVHLLIHDTAIANWRPYLIDLATEVDQHASRLLGASPDNQGPIGMHDCGERQALLVLDQALLTASLVVKSSIDNVQTLGEFYNSVHEMEGGNYEGEIYSFTIKEQLRELHQISGRIDALRMELQSITNLVASFLDLSSGFALQDLAKESGKENEQMRLLTQKSSQDAAAVKVLTILTLIYLPATVVSNFFSTSFVKAASGDSGHIVISSDWWILVAASVPLTILTLYIWYVWMRIKAHGIHPFWWPRQQYAVESEHRRTRQINWEEKV